MALAIPTRVPLATWHALAELLGKCDDDALRSADVGWPVRVAILHFANELGPVGAHARYHNIDFINGEHNATDAQRVYRRFDGPKPDRVGRVELVQLNALPIGSAHHGEGGSDILESDQ